MAEAAFDPRPLLAALADPRLEIVLIGGLALVARGIVQPTGDIDFCYAPTRETAAGPHLSQGCSCRATWQQSHAHHGSRPVATAAIDLAGLPHCSVPAAGCTCHWQAPSAQRQAIDVALSLQIFGRR